MILQAFRQCFAIGILYLFYSGAAVAQNRYEPLLTFESNQEFPVDSETFRIESGRIFAQLRDATADLHHEEQRLLIHKEHIEGAGHSAESFLDEMEGLIERIDPAVRAALLASPMIAPESFHSAELERVRLTLELAKPEVRELFTDLDIYIQESLDVAMAIGLHSLRSDLAILQNPPQEIREAYTELLNEMKLYIQNKNQYGQGKDVQRTSPYYRFFTHLKKLYSRIDRLEMTHSERLRARIEDFSNRMHKWAQRLPFYIRALPSSLSLVRAVLGEQQPVAQFNPVSSAIQKVSLALGGTLPPVEVEGRENLPVTAGSNEVFVFAPSHREGLADQVGVASLGVDNLVMLAAVSNFVSSSMNRFFGFKDLIIERLNKNSGMVVVGPRANPEPIDKALEILRTTQMRSFLIYPGGRLPEGLGASMGVRARFLSEDGLIGQLESAGYKINIIPVSMRHNARLFDGRRITDSPTLTVKVGHPLKDETRRVLVRLAGPESLSLLMRYGLIEDLVTDNDLLWGQVRGSKLGRILGEYLGCANLLIPNPP